MYKTHPLYAVWKEGWQTEKIHWATDGRWHDNCLSSDNLNLISFLIKIKNTSKLWEKVKKPVIYKTNIRGWKTCWWIRFRKRGESQEKLLYVLSIWKQSSQTLRQQTCTEQAKVGYVTGLETILGVTQWPGRVSKLSKSGKNNFESI